MTAESLANALKGEKHFSIPVILDNDELGEVDATLSNLNELKSFDAKPLLDWLRPVLLPGKLADFQTRIGTTERISPSAFDASGIGFEYDAANLEIHLLVPADMRRGIELRLGAGGLSSRASVATMLRPASVSGYINIRAADDYVTSGSPQKSAWQPPIIDLDGAVNIFGTALEGVATYRGGSENRWSRGDVRLTHDFPDSRIRITAGDLAYGVDGFQSFQPAGGLSIGRDFGLQPYRSSTPTGQTTLLVDRSSRVDVLVNGQHVETLNLKPGQYNVRDFPFAAGTNDVTLRITDEVGRVQSVIFPFVYDSAVLAKGEQDFHYSLGFVGTPTLTGRIYDTKRLLFSAYHVIGVTDQVTLGANVQGSPQLKMGGVEARWATSLGSLRADVSGSDFAGGKSGYAIRVQYRYVDAVRDTTLARSIEASVNYRSPAFASLGSGIPSNPVSWDIGVRYGQRIFDKLYGSMGVSWQKGRDGVRDAHMIDVGFSSPVTKNLNTYVLLGRSHPSFGPPQNRIFLALSWFPSNSGHSVTGTYDTRTNNAQLQWHYSPPRTVDALEANAVTERNGNRYSLRGEAEYTGYRFLAGMSHDTELDQTGQGFDQHRTSVHGGTALAFADGHIAISRPIADSFAMVVPHPSLAGHTVDVNANTNVPEARTDTLGAAVLPDLASYYNYPALLSAGNLPDGLDLGREFYTLLPSYRSGTIIPAGTGATVLLQAGLVDKDGTPLDLELGTIGLSAAPNQSPIDFFTGRDGRLHVAGIIPGEVTIRLANYPEAPVTIRIPDKAAGIYEAGTIKMAIDPKPSNRQGP